MFLDGISQREAINAKLAQPSSKEPEAIAQDVHDEVATNGMADKHQGQDLQQDDHDGKKRPHCSAMALRFSLCVLLRSGKLAAKHTVLPI